MLDSQQVQYLAQEIAVAIDQGLKAGAAQQPTLRDRFAMAALAGMLARRAGDPSKDPKQAYEYADGMLLARDKPRGDEFVEVTP